MEMKALNDGWHEEFLFPMVDVSNISLKFSFAQGVSISSMSISYSSRQLGFLADSPFQYSNIPVLAVVEE